MMVTKNCEFHALIHDLYTYPIIVSLFIISLSVVDYLSVATATNPLIVFVFNLLPPGCTGVPVSMATVSLDAWLPGDGRFAGWRGNVLVNEFVNQGHRIGVCDGDISHALIYCY